ATDRVLAADGRAFRGVVRPQLRRRPGAVDAGQPHGAAGAGRGRGRQARVARGLRRHERPGLGAL
ncbi:MAG: hypothetical protein AVDCRST_MAG07-3549, partial [uncultured Frankineae bacterium]